MTVVSKKETHELHELLAGFLRRKDPTTKPKPRDLQTLRSFLRSNVKRDMAADIDYLGEDLVDRLELIRRIRKICLAKDNDTIEEDRETLSRATLWSLLLVTDMVQLRKIASDLEEGDDAREDALLHLPEAADGVHDMVWFFTKGPKAEWKREDQVSRNSTLAGAVLERDGMHCVLTGSNNPEVCHIWPFWAANRKKQASKAVRALAFVFGRERIKEIRKKLASENSDTVDTPGNMITLSRQLHRYWEEGYFALEPIGPVFKPAHVSTTSNTAEEDTAKETSTPIDDAKNDPPKGLRKRASDRLREKKEERDAKRATMQIEGVKVRFHWLKRTTRESMYTILGPNAELNPRKMWKDWENNIVVHDVDGRPLENGHILEIFPTSQAEAPDMDILRLQWDILRMHALSGGADPVLYAPDYDYDEDGRRVSVDRPERVRALEALKDNRVELEAERPMETSPDVPEATMPEVAEVASTGRSVSGTSTLRNMAATAVNSISRRTGRAIRRLGGDDGDDSTILSGRPTTPSITRGLVSRLRPRRVSHAVASVHTTASSADRGDRDRPFTEVDAPRSARSSGEHSPQRRRQSRLPSESRPSIEARHRTRSGRPSGEHPHKNRLSTEASTAQGGGRPSGEHSQKNLSIEAATAQGGGRLSGEQTMLPLRPRPGTVLGEITNVASTRVTTRMSEDDAVGGENRDPTQTDVNH